MLQHGSSHWWTSVSVADSELLWCTAVSRDVLLAGKAGVEWSSVLMWHCSHGTHAFLEVAGPRCKQD